MFECCAKKHLSKTIEMRSALIFFVLCVICCCQGLEERDNSTVRRNGYAFYYPVNVNAIQPTKACLAIDEHLLPAVVRINPLDTDCVGTTCQPHNVTAGFSCWDIVVVDNDLQIEIKTSDNNVKFQGRNRVGVHYMQPITILETDRKTYKMGDTVKIRILAIGFDLKPIKGYQLSHLRIQSPPPARTVVKEWKKLQSKLGLIHLEFQLASDTPEGDWEIHGNILYSKFTVEKYVLPRFQATINGPQGIYKGSKSTSYTVCGTYSYGKTIKGVALLTAKNQKSLTFNHIKNLTEGCAKFEISREDLGFDKNEVSSIEFSATVTEDGTQQVESVNMRPHIFNEAYSAQLNQKNQYIKPNLPYKGELILSHVQVPLTAPKVEICYKFVQPDANGSCSNFTLGPDNRLEFVLPPTNVPDDGSIVFQAKVINHPLSYTPSRTLTVWHSKSKNGIKIMDSQQNPVDCKSNLEYVIFYNSGRFADNEEVDFKYILTSRNNILNTGTVRDKPKKQPLNLDELKNVIGKESYNAERNPIDKFKLKIKLDKKVYTNSRLVVFYDYDGEVISDTIEIDVNMCAPNPVKAKWAEESLYPGEMGNLKIKADKGSLCSVSTIDKASTFLGSSSKINIEAVLNKDRPDPYYSAFPAYNCIRPEEVQFPHRIAYLRFGGGYSSHKYSFIPRPRTFLHRARIAPAPTAAPALPLDNDRGSAVRSFFPETWLWDLVTVEDGETNLERKLPDSITNWEGKVVCVSSDKGFGVSDKIEIQGFKPFFVDILLPYSIKRNKEILHLRIMVFNYLNHSLPVRVTLETVNGIVLVDGEDKNSFSLCLGAEDRYTHTYRIKATKLGSLNITVSGYVDPTYAENCAPDSVTGRRDVVQKSLLVEVEGYPSSLVKSTLLCTNDSSGTDKITWNISLPENVVLDTVDGKVTLNSDILGPMFQNLENILEVPTGCGEQIMATLTPNLYVLQYLEANNALTDEIKERLLKNLETGYQRMLNYVHNDGSFSAFGKTDRDGSMFLTAFVVRTFMQMKNHILIDYAVINKALRWMKWHQLENGCFNPMRHVFHEMGLASSRNQTTALTSYVIISLLENHKEVDKNMFTKATQCILNDTTIDKYTMAISSFALGLLNMHHEAKQRLDKLLELRESKVNQLWWKQSENSLSANVETSSYVLVSLLRQDPVANLGTASSIVRWLHAQMNPRGAFSSTTDTVVGLDAISRYALLVNKNEPNVRVSLATKTDKKEIEIIKRDRERIDVLPLIGYPNEVKAKITGDGCVSLQAELNYYLNTVAALDDLELEINLKPVNQRFKCSFIELKPCVSYAGVGQINMAIVEVNMPSGYVPDQASLYALRTENDSGVKKFEVIKNQVVFYLTQLGAAKVCLPFTIEENLVVENVANATIKFYDYYKPEVSISKSFKSEDCEVNINVPA